MKRSVLLAIQAGTARAREGERVQREKNSKGLHEERESPMVIGLIASARREQLSSAWGVEPQGFVGVTPADEGRTLLPIHVSRRDRCYGARLACSKPRKARCDRTGD